MSPKKAQRIVSNLFVVLILCLIAAVHAPRPYGGLFAWFVIIILVAIGVLEIKYNRCPKCGVPLRRASFYPNCSCCGADLEKRPEDFPENDDNS